MIWLRILIAILPYILPLIMGRQRRGRLIDRLRRTRDAELWRQRYLRNTGQSRPGPLRRFFRRFRR